MNTFEKILKEIKKITENRELTDLSQIETDLIKEKLRQCYDLLLENPLKDSGLVVKKETEPEKTINPTSIEEDIQEAESDTSEIESEEIMPVELPAREETKETKQEKTPGKNIELEVTNPDLFSSSEPGSDTEIKTVAENISSEINEESVAEKIKKSKKISSLKDSIGINEKFFFINELFGGNLNDYNKAIDELDKVMSMQEAGKLLDEYTHTYSWPEESEALNQMKDFLEHKLK